MSQQDLTPFLDARQNQLQLEMAAADAIDTKALGVLASDFAMLLFIAQSAMTDVRAAFTLLITLALVISLLLSCAAIWPRDYAGTSTNALEHPEYLKFGSAKLVRQLIADSEIAILQNQSINKHRWKQCSQSLILTLLASAMLFAMIYFK